MIPRQNQLPQDLITDPQRAVRVMQVICAILMLGVLTLALFALASGFHPGQAGGLPGVQTRYGVIPLFVAIMMVYSRVVFVPAIVKGSTKKLVATRRIEDITKLDFYRIYQVQMIVGYALLEGAAFFILVSVLMSDESQLWQLAIMPGLLAMMAAAFPTIKRVDSWADEQLRLTRLSASN